MKPYYYFLFMLISLFILLKVNKSPKSKIRLIFKMITSLSFMIIGISSYYISGSNFYYCLLIIVGLCFSFMGDLFLGIKYIKVNIMFILGVTCFTLTHIFYSLAFISLIPVNKIDIFSTIILSIIIIFTYISIDSFNFRNSFIIVCIYIIVICFMLCKSLSLIKLDIPSEATVCIVLGAVLFTASDIILSFVYFYNKPPRFLSELNLILYYLGQGLIALSIMFI